MMIGHHISIHALVKRATCACVIINVNGGYFNPRPREEGDYSGILEEFIEKNFNPRPREEGDVVA